MTPAKAEILSGLAGAAVFLLTFLLFSWPLGIGVVIAVLLYAGANLLLGGFIEDQVQLIFGSSKIIAQLSAQIDLDRKAIKNLRRLAKSIADLSIQKRVEAVCDIAEKIFDNFVEDPDDLKQAQRFVVQFQKLLPIVENYVHLSSDPDRREVLTSDDEAAIRDTLDAYTGNLKEAYQAYQENNLQKLRMATGVLKRMVDMDGVGRKSSG
ncbi:MAG: 5-bromo-4-chloroindolyl phosphate hydrolysis family protein [Desulfobacterales bacterium]|jgi:5-bromo-4-chloroindolyl phosphate hydrolysis protein